MNKLFAWLGTLLGTSDAADAASSAVARWDTESVDGHRRGQGVAQKVGPVTQHELRLNCS